MTASTPSIEPRSAVALNTVGPIGRLGRWTATHFRAVAAAWVVIPVGGPSDLVVPPAPLRQVPPAELQLRP